METILITGASGGIGEAFASKLAERKHNLLLVARNAGKLEKLCKEFADKFGLNAQFITADLAKQRMAEQVFVET